MQPAIALTHFKSTQHVLETALDEYLCDLREEEAHAIGSGAEACSDEEYDELLAKIEAVKGVLEGLR